MFFVSVEGGGNGVAGLSFLLRNFRSDMKKAVDFLDQTTQRKHRFKLNVPVYNIIFTDDPLTKRYQTLSKN